jgi:hypothetical protein
MSPDEEDRVVWRMPSPSEWTAILVYLAVMATLITLALKMWKPEA